MSGSEFKGFLILLVTFLIKEKSNKPQQGERQVEIKNIAVMGETALKLLVITHNNGGGNGGGRSKVFVRSFG
ncbi:hypothetical protein [Rufibacter roseus]|uniref:Uncharacterized protein n=1 Tax=Rufibacter roseus TaxID=1567108 RepID=A0ABW2DM79_9BACT|nr:hypothetical protein [Rufibacter roseus]